MRISDWSSDVCSSDLPMAAWRSLVLTLFPEMFPGPLGFSLAGKALERGLWALDVLDIRDFARDKHRSVDDAPFGGGARSGERRVGKECVRTCRSRWSPYH